ncbi:TonB-dependent receptor [Ferruginibacter sp. HRS2-29]|uniref:TonB-dependent receptor n=1 Tax=Ferruginibacter sp. HRS2-29 TaxID=2487334 RepID=UPI0020CCC8DE|nr:TonB-dependent receptor [Ferruginibacter sp. HRS2-29]
MRKTTLLFFYCMISLLCKAQMVHTGKVTDENGKPLRGVTVTAGKNIFSTITDSAGSYFISREIGNADLSFSHVGFLSSTTSAGQAFGNIIKLYRNNEFLDETIVTAFENNTTLNRVPAAVSVLGKTLLNRYGGQSFVAAINTVPGVKMDERSPGSYRLSIRGNLLRSTFGVRNVKVYWNGIPFTDASGNTYFNQLSQENIGRIEIIKGPSGSMYGSGTGGVVLLGTSLPVTREKTISVNAAAGSYGMFSTGAAYTQSGTNATSLSFQHQQSDGYRVQTNMRRDVANYTGSYRINSRQRIHANVFYSDLFYQTPGGLTIAELSANPRQARPAAGAFPGAVTQKAAIYLKTIYAGISHEYEYGRWSHTSALYGSYTDFKNPTIRNYEDKYERGIGGRTVSKYKGKTLAHTFGGEYQSGFVNTSVHGNRSGIKDTLQYHDKIQSRQFNIFLQSEYSPVRNFSVTAGVSYNNFHYGFRRLSEAQKRSSDFTPQFVPRIAASLKLGQSYLYANVSKGYSPPSIDEVHASDGIFNTGLKAESAFHYETGIRTIILPNKLWLDGSIYLFQLRNTIVSRRDSGGADYYVNAGKTRQAGVEVGLIYLPVNNQVDFVRQLKLRVNYTYIHARFGQYQQGVNTYDGNRLTGTPPDVLIGAADISTAPGIYLNLTYNYTARLPVNDANTFFATSYNLFIAKAGYKINFRQKASADIYAAYEHSFNTPYSLGNDLNAAGNRFFNPSAPSTFTVGARFGFTVK